MQHIQPASAGFTWQPALTKAGIMPCLSRLLPGTSPVTDGEIDVGSFVCRLTEGLGWGLVGVF